MDLTPGEKAVLGQIRVLYCATAQREQPIKALHAQWLPAHYEAYRKAYGGLLAKRLVQATSAQMFTITDAGLQAIGVATPRKRAQAPERRLAQAGEPLPRPPSSPDARRRRGSGLSRLVKGLLGAKG
jgi:hypothetical protein